MASPPKAEQAGCSVSECDGRHVARGFCRRHYRKFMRYGDPLAGRSYKDTHHAATATEKPCTRCGEVKPLDQFAPDKRGFLGRAASCRPCWNAYCRERLKRPEVKAKRRLADQQPERKRKIRLAYVARKYGASAVALEERRMAGEGCAACGSTERVCIDHCHASGAARGLLCNRCNTTLGAVGDDPNLLLALANYLQA